MKLEKWIWRSSIFSVAFLVLALAGSVHAGTVPSTPVVDFWRTGVQVNGTPADYASLIGRGRSAAGWFQSADGDSYYVLGAPGAMMKVSYALARVLTRSGSYLGGATLSLEVRGLNGSLVRTLTQNPLDLQASPTTAWMILPLSISQADRMLQPGEYLAFHFQLGGLAGGTLDVQTLFEVAFSHPLYQTFIPMIRR